MELLVVIGSLQLKSLQLLNYRFRIWLNLFRTAIGLQDFEDVGNCGIVVIIFPFSSQDKGLKID